MSFHAYLKKRSVDVYTLDQGHVTTFFKRKREIFTLCTKGIDIESSHSSLLAKDP